MYKIYTHTWLTTSAHIYLTTLKYKTFSILFTLKGLNKFCLWMRFIYYLNLQNTAPNQKLFSTRKDESIIRKTVDILVCVNHRDLIKSAKKQRCLGLPLLDLQY